MSTALGKRSRAAGRLAALAALRDVVTNPNLRRLELAWCGFTLADSAYAVALAVFAFEAGGPGAVGIVLVCRLLPAALATPIVTAYSDRHRGERVLAATVTARAAVLAGVAVATLSASPLALIYALVAIDAVAMTAFRPTKAALLVPASRSPGELLAANSATTMVESMSVLVGPLIAAALLATMSATSVFVAAAIVLLAAAIVSATIRIPGQDTAVSGAAGGESSGFAAELVAGVRLLGSVPQSALVVGLFSAQALVSGMWTVLAVVVALELLDTGNAGVGALQAALGAGGLIGAFGTLALVGRRGLAKPLALGLALWGPPIALIAVFPQPAIALCLVGVLGAAAGLVYVAGLSLLQRMMASDVLGRVFGVLQSVALVAIGLGAVLTPPLIEALELRGALFAVAIVMPVLVALCWHRLGEIDRGAIGNERALAALGDVALFRGLAPLALEQLAAATVSLAAPAGSEVIRQGDRGDRFYVIAEGLLDTYVDGQLVATLGPGGSFGEIALLHDVPRTATVRARTGVELYALERADFLAALTGRPAGPVATLVDARLRTRPLERRPEDTDAGAALTGRDGAEVLRSVPAFASLPPDALADLARRLIGVSARRGAEITRQGDYGERFYIVLAGSVEITVDGRPVATLAAGDCFGEGALVHDAPRNATATALTAVTLLALERADYLGALTLI